MSNVSSRWPMPMPSGHLDGSCFWIDRNLGEVGGVVSHVVTDHGDATTVT